jgi:hypothetical protein
MIAGWCAYKLANKMVNRPDSLIREQKYAVYLIFLLQFADVLVGMLINSELLEEPYLDAAEVFLRFSFNWHLLLIVFYLHYLQLQLEDPLRSKLSKELQAFIVVLIIAAIMS